MVEMMGSPLVSPWNGHKVSTILTSEPSEIEFGALWKWQVETLESTNSDVLRVRSKANQTVGVDPKLLSLPVEMHPFGNGYMVTLECRVGKCFRIEGTVDTVYVPTFERNEGPVYSASMTDQTSLSFMFENDARRTARLSSIC